MRILYDASRLLTRAERPSPTGVDRVCLAYADWLAEHPDVLLVPVRGRKGRLVEVDPVWFKGFIKALRERWDGVAQSPEDMAHEAALLKALRAEERPLHSVISAPPPVKTDTKSTDKTRVLKQFFRSNIGSTPQGDLYLNVGHTTLVEPDILQALEANGIERVIMIHDLIPVTHPEFCRSGDGEKHVARVDHALKYASRILVNSRYTEQELLAFAKRRGLDCPPVHVAHLGLEPAFEAGEAFEAPRPYFIHVGTIEARKNLAMLLTLWRRLEERLGDQTPSLVLVGRYGWENEAVLDLLLRTPNLRGVVYQASNISDASLVRLMRGARAVLAPSSVEGFDLPAVEACALGVPLIASDIPPHRELTPSARLVDPLDGLGWLRALEETTLVPPPPPAPYGMPRWSDHFAVVAKAIGVPAL